MEYKHKKATIEDKKEQWSSKKAKERKPEKYHGDARIKIEGDNLYKRCVHVGQDCLVHNSRWINKFLLYFFSLIMIPS